jgi:hypothetical protein
MLKTVQMMTGTQTENKQICEKKGRQLPCVSNFIGKLLQPKGEELHTTTHFVHNYSKVSFLLYCHFQGENGRPGIKLIHRERLIFNFTAWKM